MVFTKDSPPDGWGDDSTFRRERQAVHRRTDEITFNQMVDNRVRLAILNRLVENRLDTTFHALADPTRRGMLANLALGEKSIGELGEPFRMTFAGASKHVKVLESAGLIERRRDGRKQICTLKPGPLEEAERWLRQWEKFWNARLDRLEALIEHDKKKENRND
jgi:DNA-binding transcriptional ArsR family regulator